LRVHACAELGDWDRAEGHWRQALHVDPQAEEALIHLAEARRELEDLDGARRYLRECLLHHPESVDAQTRLAELEAN
jgi:tetratricopeptide (TPR) repeat protein